MKLSLPYTGLHSMLIALTHRFPGPAGLCLVLRISTVEGPLHTGKSLHPEQHRFTPSQAHVSNDIYIYI